jgi:hypothetical protein
VIDHHKEFVKNKIAMVKVVADLKILIIRVAVATVVRTTVAFQTLKVILIIQSMKVMAITRKLMTMVKMI